MKGIKWLSNERFALKLAVLMNYICILLMLASTFGLALSFIGRQTFILVVGDETFTEAIFAGGHHDNWWNVSNTRLPVVEMNDDIRVFVDDYIGVSTQIGMSIMYSTNAIPAIIGYWLLSRVFRNVGMKEIFTEQNVIYLSTYGLLGVATAVLSPFVKLGIAGVTNFVGNNTIHIATGQDSFNILIPSLASLIVAYVINNGILSKHNT